MGLLILSGSRAVTAAPNPYAISAEDLARIPWHSGAGNWGAQVAVTTPTLPVTSGSPVLVSNIAEFESAAETPGQIIQFDTSVSEDSILDIAADDLDIIIPSGIVVGSIAGEQDRIRIRGSTPGQHSGGRMGQVRLTGDDFIIDGVSVNSSGQAGTEGLQAFRMGGNRHGIYNVRAVAPAYAYQGGGGGLIIKNSNIYAGAWTRAQCTAWAGSSYIEGWGIRFSGSGPVTILGSDIRTTRYHVLRFHTTTGVAAELYYVGRSRLVALAEKKAIWVRDANTDGDGPAEGFIIEDSEIYGHSDCGENAEANMANPNGTPCLYSRGRNCDYFTSGNGTDYSQDLLDANEALAGDHDWGTGNTFSAWTVYPTYDMNSSGDPEDIPLPGLTYALSYGEGSCVGFPDS